MSDEVTQVRPARNSTEGGLGRSSPRLTTRKAPQPPDDVPARWAGDPAIRERFTELTAIKDSINTVATSVAIADRRMHVIGKKLDDCIAVVGGLEGTFSGLPKVEEDRAVLLRLYGDLRKAIDRLTRSTDPGAQMILSRRKAEEPDQWLFPLGTRGLWSSIRRHEVHAGKAGLNLPELTSGSTRQDVEGAAAALRDGTTMLERRRMTLREDAFRVFGVLSDGGLDMLIGRKVLEGKGSADDRAADLESGAAKLLISKEMDGILHAADPILSRALV